MSTTQINRCFGYAVLSALHRRGKDPQRARWYETVFAKRGLQNIQYPVTHDHIPTIVDKLKICINIGPSGTMTGEHSRVYISNKPYRKKPSILPTRRHLLQMEATARIISKDQEHQPLYGRYQCSKGEEDSLVQDVLGTLPKSSRIRVAPAVLSCCGEGWTSLLHAITREMLCHLLPQHLDWHPSSSADLRRLRILLSYQTKQAQGRDISRISTNTIYHAGWGTRATVISALSTTHTK